MMANITLTETVIKSFVTGIFNVVASMSIENYVDYAEPNCSFAMKVN